MSAFNINLMSLISFFFVLSILLILINILGRPIWTGQHFTYITYIYLAYQKRPLKLLISTLKNGAITFSWG